MMQTGTDHAQNTNMMPCHDDDTGEVANSMSSHASDAHSCEECCARTVNVRATFCVPPVIIQSNLLPLARLHYLYQTGVAIIIKPLALIAIPV